MADGNRIKAFASVAWAKFLRAINKTLEPFDYSLRRSHSLEQAAWISEMGITTVLDIGANTGQFSTSIRKVLPKARIYAFEPVEECYLKLSQRMRADDFFECFPYALGAEDGRTALNKNEFTPSSSILPMTEGHVAEFPFTAEASTTEVEVRSLDSVAPTLDLRGPLLVKMDVQGFEGRVVEGGRETLSRAEVVIVEVLLTEFYEGQTTFHELYGELSELGLSFSGVMEQAHSSSNDRPLYCDTIFVRELTSRKQ